MGWSIKKPLGGGNSFIQQTVKKPGNTLIGLGTGGLGTGPLTGSLLGSGLTSMQADAKNKYNEYLKKLEGLNSQNQSGIADLERLAAEEEAKRKALGEQQQKQILSFADEQQGRANAYRKTLADSLTKSGQEFFNLENPSILEDLNSRGLFTSQTARDKAQADALKEIELNNQQQLSNFDTRTFNDINDIRGTALSALLGGDQSALDSALDLRKASIQRGFDQADQERQNSFADMLAKRKSRDQLISSLLGLGGNLGSGLLGSL